ncbi:MAG: four-helix bundle copper-binding protein [Anaerolineae bacterium]
MTNYEEMIHGCSDCISACKSSMRDAWMKAPLSKEEKECARMWNDCATICEASIHLLSRGSMYSENILKLCEQICGDCSKECSKHNSTSCKKVANACKKCMELCHKHGTSIRKSA